jgi:ribosomal protein S15P/S13E
MGLYKLNSKLSKLENELKKAKKDYDKEKTRVSSLTKEQRVAEYLHDAFCHFNHIDACSWFYDDGSWTSYNREEYLSKSKKLLKFYNEDQIYDIVNTFKLCKII